MQQLQVRLLIYSPERSGAETNGALCHNEQLAYAYDGAGNLNLRTNDALSQTFVVDSLKQWAEVNQEGTGLLVEFYARQSGGSWSLTFDEAIGALESARKRLTGGK